MNWPNGKACALSFTFDDARATQLTKAVPLLNEHGVKGTFYVYPNQMRQQLDAWKRVVADGHEIGCHTISHPCSAARGWYTDNVLEDYGLDRMDGEIVRANAVIEVCLGVTPKTFAYPCGDAMIGIDERRRSYVPLVEHYFIAGRTLEEKVNVGNDKMSELAGVCLDNWQNYEGWLQQAREQYGWLICVTHEIGDPKHPQTTSEEGLREVLRLAKEHFWIAPVAEVAEWLQKQRS